VAERLDCDDVLFSLLNQSSALAVVHLTYAEREVSSRWPDTQFYENLEDWIENCMKPDHQAYQ
jgi:hypothetical protein